MSIIKLDKYNGSTPLETFIAKFENSSEFYSWDERAKAFHLKSMLENQAAEILWILKPGATASEIFDLLRVRFGNENQRERYKRELRSRKRKPGESLQSLYHDLQRLLSLSYPQESNNIVEDIGKEAFLSALNNDAFMTRVRDGRPKTLADALALACYMESYTEETQSEEKRKVREVRSSAETETQQRMQQMENNLRQLETKVDKHKRESAYWKQQAQSRDNPSAQGSVPSDPVLNQHYTPPLQPAAAVAHNRRPAWQRGTGRRGGVNETRGTRACYICGNPSHYMRNCPHNQNNPGGSDQGGQQGPSYNTTTQPFQSANVSGSL
jgi:tellurite resistance protein